MSSGPKAGQSFNRPQALTLSGCFKAGQAVCTSCHVAHGSRNPFSLKVNITQGRTGDLLCVQCHAAGAAGASGATGAPRVRLPQSQGLRDPIAPWPNEAIEQHTFHKAASAGSPNLSHERRELAIAHRGAITRPAAVAETTAASAAERPCNDLHDERSRSGRAAEVQWGVTARQSVGGTTADRVSRGSGGRQRPAVAGQARGRSNAGCWCGQAPRGQEKLALGTAGAGRRKRK